jgi:hypothetical protein
MLEWYKGNPGDQVKTTDFIHLRRRQILHELTDKDVTPRGDGGDLSKRARIEVIRLMTSDEAAISQALGFLLSAAGRFFLKYRAKISAVCGKSTKVSLLFLPALWSCYQYWLVGAI